MNLRVATVPLAGWGRLDIDVSPTGEVILTVGEDDGALIFPAAAIPDVIAALQKAQSTLSPSLGPAATKEEP